MALRRGLGLGSDIFEMGVVDIVDIAGSWVFSICVFVA